MHIVYGIRHHGPGCAKALRDALARQRPDCLLIEGPAEADLHVADLADPDMAPPLALLLYDVQQPNRALSLPFAVFSPEWQAIHYGLAQGIPVRFMDLPAAHTLAGIPEETTLLPDADADPSRDPLGMVAQLAGFDDGERWWEHTFEQQEHGPEVFAAILQLMEAMRRELARVETRETLVREAHMRKTLRKALKDGFTNIAVVCGAWHAPVLADLKAHKSAADGAALRGLPKAKVAAAWVPWSYERLTWQGGYGAGVQSPAWYEALFLHPTDTTTHWMTRLSQLLRAEGMGASPAHAVTAVHLAETLAAMNGQGKPAVAELRDAALAVYAEGHHTVLDLVQKRLVVGTAVGRVSEHAPKMPLQQDVAARIKATRLTKYWGVAGRVYLKATAANPLGGIDLRDEADLAKSHFLRQLNLLGVRWGTPSERDNAGRPVGSFLEIWRMVWRPELAIALIEANLWGSTVYEAALGKVAKDADGVDSLADAVALADEVLKADLQPLLPRLIALVQSQAALSHDVVQLMAGFPTLAQIALYGNVRGTDTAAIGQVTAELVPRICLGLPAATLHVDDDTATLLSTHLQQCQHAFGLLGQPDYDRQWYACLALLAERDATHPLLRGLATRLRFDRGHADLPTATRLMHYALSKANPPAQVAQWLEGFLHGSALLLLHHPKLWQLLDAWVATLTDETLTETLPLLRRAFSHFAAPERQRILALAQAHADPSRRPPPALHEASALDMARAQPVAAALRMLLQK